MQKIQHSSIKRNIHKSELKDKSLVFSYKYVAFPRDKFQLNDRDFNYYLALFNRLKEACKLTCAQFLNNRTKTWRTHPIDWDDTTEPSGFSHLNSQLRDLPAWQFNISRDEHGRVHGFVIDDVFYLIWFDPKHELYNGKKH